MSYNITGVSILRHNLTLPITEKEMREFAEENNISIKSSRHPVLSVEGLGDWDCETKILEIDTDCDSYQWCVKPLLPKTKGEFEAVVVWEGGDSVENVRWVDGRDERIDLCRTSVFREREQQQTLMTVVALSGHAEKAANAKANYWKNETRKMAAKLYDAFGLAAHDLTLAAMETLETDEPK